MGTYPSLVVCFLRTNQMSSENAIKSRPCHLGEEVILKEELDSAVMKNQSWLVYIDATVFL